jgi:hypothetical protein
MKVSFANSLGEHQEIGISVLVCNGRCCFKNESQLLHTIERKSGCHLTPVLVVADDTVDCCLVITSVVVGSREVLPAIRQSSRASVESL